MPQQIALHDIYGPVEVPEPFPYIKAALIATVLCLVGLIAYLLWRRHKNAPAPPIPPWDLALHELAEAKAMRTPEQGLAYMNRASLILRNYIDSRFEIKSTRQTTMEFLHSEELASVADLHDFRSELQQCLEQADMAKFAHLIPDKEDLVNMEDSVTNFVIKTRPPQSGKQTAVPEVNP